MSAAGLRALEMPPWVTAYPGASIKVQQLPGMVAATYLTDAKPPMVIAHYEKLWTAAGQSFAPNFNGTGTSIRATAAECDLLVVVREDGDGSHVRVTCAVREAPPAPSAPASRPMSDFGNPAHPFSPREPDWVPLDWPVWLVPMMPGASKGLDVQEGKDGNGRRVLTSRYRTAQPMSKLYEHYQSLMSSYGFRVVKSALTTGQTIGGTVQNKSGFVKGTYEPRGPGRGGLATMVRFSRANLNDPIQVVMEVSLEQVTAQN